MEFLSTYQGKCIVKMYSVIVNEKKPQEVFLKFDFLSYS